MISRRIGLVLIIIFVSAAVSSAQSSDTGYPAGAVTVTRIDISIDGSTNPNAVLRELLISEGKEFRSAARLQDILDTRASMLKSRRLFKVFTWNLEFPSPGEAVIDIEIVDSFTLLPRPMFKYSTSTGLLLGAKVEYFNAFGTLTDQTLEAYWSQEEIKGSLIVENIAIGMTHLSLGYEQFYGSTRYGSQSGETILEYKNNSSTLVAMLDIPFGPGSEWSYRIAPVFLWQYGYDIITNTNGYPQSDFVDEGFGMGFLHGFYTSQIEWVGNFRRGFKVDTRNENIWYLNTENNDSFLEADVFGYLPLASWFEISGRVGGFVAMDGTREEAGDRLRGVVDYMTYGHLGVFVNAQVNFRVIPSRGFLEAQLRPFFDAGYVVSEVWGYGPEAWEYCVGSTAILYFDALPSMALNIEFGWDLKRNRSEVIIDTTLLL